MDIEPLSPSWQVVARLQAQLERTARAGEAALADEEALTELLDDFAVGLSPAADDLERRFRSLSRNRRRKHRRRRDLLTAQVRLGQARDAKEPPQVVAAEQSDSLARIRQASTPREWNFLYGAALGLSVADLGRASSMTQGAVRVYLHRLRRRLLAVA